MLDAVELEKHGVPTAAICTDPFDLSASAMAEAHGMQGYPYAIMEHPLGSRTEEELEELAREIADRIDFLLSPEVQQPRKQTAV